MMMMMAWSRAVAMELVRSVRFCIYFESILKRFPNGLELGWRGVEGDSKVLSSRKMELPFSRIEKTLQGTSLEG